MNHTFTEVKPCTFKSSGERGQKFIAYPTQELSERKSIRLQHLPVKSCKNLFNYSNYITYFIPLNYVILFYIILTI